MFLSLQVSNHFIAVFSIVCLYVQAFPDTPWAFIYRNPVQTMMSHLDPRKGGGQSGAVCLRSQSERPKQITDHLKELKLRSSPESWQVITRHCFIFARTLPSLTVYSNSHMFHSCLLLILF